MSVLRHLIDDGVSPAARARPGPRSGAHPVPRFQGPYRGHTMSLRFIGRAVAATGAAAVLLLLAPGCAEDNEKKANIVGGAGEAGGTPTATSQRQYNELEAKRFSGNPYQQKIQAGAAGASK